MAQANITSHVRLRNHISGYTDVIQMLTGVLLCCFVLMHMVLVSSVILSPKIMDSLAVFRDRHPCHGQRARHQHSVEFAHLRG